MSLQYLKVEDVGRKDILQSAIPESLPQPTLDISLFILLVEAEFQFDLLFLLTKFYV